MTFAGRFGVAALGRLPPETAHALGLALLRLGAGAPRAPSPMPRVRLWGQEFGAVGVAAGLDKDAAVFAPLLRAGAGFVEVGTVTPRAQRGNPRPRLFRLRADEALVNRLGFNGAGMERAARRLAARDRSLGPVGVNIGPNRDSPSPLDGYAAAFDALAPVADYVAVNVSSPNTPGLRGLQAPERLAALVGALRARRAAAALDLPLLVKVAPDLDPPAVRELAALAPEAGIDGLIVGNTTTARPPGLRSRYRREVGGLSGRPLFAPSTALLREFYRLTEGRIPLVGVGGVFDSADAWAKIRAGASLVQLYTALAFRGLDVLPGIARGLSARLAAGGFASVADAVGADA